MDCQGNLQSQDRCYLNFQQRCEILNSRLAELISTKQPRRFSRCPTMSAPRKPLTGIEGERLTYWRTNERPEADTLG